jgi:hypothetical protein
MTSGFTYSPIISPTKMGVLHKVVLAASNVVRFVVKMQSVARAASHQANHPGILGVRGNSAVQKRTRSSRPRVDLTIWGFRV